MSNTVPRLNVWKLVTVSYRLMHRYLRDFLVVGWLPIGIYYGSGHLFDPSLPLSVLALVWFLLTWYRLVLLDRQVDGFKDFSAPRFLRFAGYYLALEAAPSILAWLTASVGIRFGSINWIWVTYLYQLVTLRFILILPSVALDAPLGLRSAWRKMRGNFWLTFSALILIGIVPAVLSGLILLLIISNDLPPIAVQAAYLVRSVVFFLWTAISAIAVSRIYRGLVDDGHPAPASGRVSVQPAPGQ